MQNRGDHKPPREPKGPRVVESLRKTIEWKALLESGKIDRPADIARREGITRARVTQGGFSSKGSWRHAAVFPHKIGVNRSSGVGNGDRAAALDSRH